MTALLYWPATAQSGNGITVTNFVPMNGSLTTVTFDVRWDKSAMPVDMQSDTVWVFVDYNDNFRMKRLPLLPGATLTASEPAGGRVVQYDGNEQGVWVVGNLSAGTFSAAVQLFSDTPAIGACAYASPPLVGKYKNLAQTQLVFEGSPAYELVVDAGGSTYTGYSNGSYTLPAGHVVTSFSDKTGAAGACIPMPGELGFSISPNDADAETGRPLWRGHPSRRHIAGRPVAAPVHPYGGWGTYGGSGSADYRHRRYGEISGTAVRRTLPRARRVGVRHVRRLLL
jgi:hypothetical protein